MSSSSLARVLIPVLSAVMLTPWISSGGALVLGLAVALSLGNPYGALVKTLTHRMLALAVVGLGFGMDLDVVGRVGAHGIGYTVVGIGSAFLLGWLLGKGLKVPRDTSTLITAGTAICGGSAIAAVAPVIGAGAGETSVALGTVFLLNAVGLFVFPWIGHALSLSESQFGLWCALAIHDTSSVVGATLPYGAHALEVGTTVKLARALWIVPVAGVIGYVRSSGTNAVVRTGPARRPWFILGFLLAAALVTWRPELRPYGHALEGAAKRLMVLTLFFIGLGLTRDTLRAVGVRPLLQGLVLWVIMATGSLATIFYGLIG